jgi:hypothetical protein
MKFVIDGSAFEDYKKLNNDFDKIFDYGLYRASEDYADYIKKKYLSGQKMNIQTGELYKSVKFLKDKQETHSFVVMAGVGVKGHLNYLNRYTGTKHEFMSPSFNDWKSQKRAFKIIEANFNKVSKNKGLMK